MDSAGSVTPGTVHHVAGSADFPGDTMAIWLDGTKTDGATTWTGTAYTMGTEVETDRIGCVATAPGGNAQFNGGIGELVIVRDHIWSDEEVAALALGADPRLIGPPLSFYWDLLGVADEYDQVRGQAAMIVGGSIPRRADHAPTVPFELDDIEGFAVQAALNMGGVYGYHNLRRRAT